MWAFLNRFSPFLLSGAEDDGFTIESSSSPDDVLALLHQFLIETSGQAE